MNQASNASGTTHTTMTLLDDINSSIGSISILDGRNGIYDLDLDHEHDHEHDTTSNTTISQNSQCYTDSMERMRQNVALGSDTTTHRIYNYRKRRYIEYEHLRSTTCEDICIEFSREMDILPNTRYLFGLRVFDEAASDEWCLADQQLKSNVTYCFRMRFKVPSLDVQLQTMDPNAYEYLYNQMRYDMVHECIPAIKYPLKKDNVMGLGAVNMYIDLLEQRETIDRIESNYKRYLPRPLVRAHKIFIKGKICKSFRMLRERQIDVAQVKWHYVRELNTLATDYLLETFVGIVDFIPGDILTTTNTPTTAKVFIKLDIFDTAEPGLKVARVTNKDKVEWVLVSKLENIYAIYTRGGSSNSLRCRLEITGMPNGYRIEFENKIQLDAFISYLAGYMRLTTKWMIDLCMQYVTPSLVELRNLRCHGPVGGAFSFAKIREQRDKCGSYIIRQCEKEYDTYYIDINTKSISEGLQPEKFKTETFKITKEICHSENGQTAAVKWKLHYNGTQEIFDKLTDLAQSIPAETEQRSRIPPTEYDKSPLLLICLPKHVQLKKTERELSEAELLRKRPQIFDPPKDLQWYHNSSRDCDNGKMTKMKADWLQDGGFKDVTVTLKVLKHEKDYEDFKDLANIWSRIYSPHIIKLYGLTLNIPYTMVMEYSKFGPLNEFLLHNKTKISLRQLLDVVHGLVRGIVYLQEDGIIHGFIRCSNLLVTKYDPKTQLLEAKISDPGFPRSYRRDDLPWIPFEYHHNLNAAKKQLDVDLWAFATTVWEIFSRGEPIVNMTSEMLRQNYNRYGGILPAPKDCPAVMFEVMMDGWSMDPDKPFNYMQIFQRLISIKESLNDDYSTIEDADDLAELDLANDVNHADDQQMRHNGFADEVKKSNFRNYFTTTPSVLEIPNGKVIFKKKVGEGHYGTVHLGEVRYNSPDNAREFVAIKTLKSLRAPQLSDDFMREIEIMESLNHPNIVKIKHWIQRPFCIIMEYLESGSFLVYLTSRKPNLTNPILLSFALDIARGMDYLASKNIIHRDLAARNILVDRDSVKISDFGLAQRADSDGYYIAHSNREIPIKWYSPEAIKKDAKFSSQSDVWSYGVTLFEMFSRGETPNLDPNTELSQDEFLQRLERGDRLRKPPLCPDNVYDRLMKTCWHANPKLRPTFREIVGVIQSIRNETMSNIPKSDLNNISPPLSPSSMN
ncbi:Tyrosine-protein kinase hopscotch [Lucilia cuprina]|uniref:non-specific protein-tyrosine kinase n=1 Tax=Lucilia cuprina TaxID=7375 RepID=A0A0L0C0I8_LUCCU|nr:Tyrosine-protein kinase hopscotch [Lucilia cuprina]